MPDLIKESCYGCPNHSRAKGTPYCKSRKSILPLWNNIEYLGKRPADCIEVTLFNYRYYYDTAPKAESFRLWRELNKKGGLKKDESISIDSQVRSM